MKTLDEVIEAVCHVHYDGADMSKELSGDILHYLLNLNNVLISIENISAHLKTVSEVLRK